MSGIIGGAGAKSGVIGTTELDYEVGEWTATLATGYTSTPTTTAFYTKIGKVIHLFMSSTFGTLGMGGSAVTITGVPFTTATSASCTSGSTARIQATDANWNVSGTTIYLQRMPVNEGGPSSTSSQSSVTFGPSFQFSLTYRIA